MSNKVAIIGAGWSGLAAAIELCEQNIPVVIFEAGRLPGGRARSVQFNEQLVLDNGQHIMLAAYQECLKLIIKVGGDTNKLFYRQALRYLDISGFDLNFSRFHHLPTKLQRLLVLVSNKDIPWREKLTLISSLQQLEKANWQSFNKLGNDCTVAEWLNQNPMPYLTKHFWLPLCLAALNTPLDKASMRVFCNVLRDSMGGNQSDALDVLVPRYPLGEIFPQLAIKYLQNNNIPIYWQTRIKKIELKNAELNNKIIINQQIFSHLIIATAPQHLSSVINVPVKYNYQPIATLYLIYEDEVCLPSVMLSLQGNSDKENIAQWLIVRPQAKNLDNDKSQDKIELISSNCLSIVLSAEGIWQDLDNQQLIRQLFKEIEDLAVNPKIKLNNKSRTILAKPPQQHYLIREARATFSCDSGLERLEQQISDNCYLAGDHCWTEYPGTLEGAVRSGKKAAQLIINQVK